MIPPELRDPPPDGQGIKWNSLADLSLAAGDGSNAWVFPAGLG